ncbi:B12-binding domain-containing radical SAM protein [Streptomyces sp. NPDC060053]|uniref:B12-binding domain-containing radical SAM protein n=1 Tax=Streptomyces sp. NPDC060053 TaxID=3347047 RepID=UPI0036946314
MKLLLLAGLGPYFKSQDDLAGSFFDPASADRLQREYRVPGTPGLRLENLSFFGPTGTRHHLLRPERSGSLSLVVGELREVERAEIPNLVAFTLRSILHGAGLDHEYFPLDDVWHGGREPVSGDVDLVLLSTTFICDRHTLARAITWIKDRFPSCPIVVGGQFSNLKYRQVLRDHPEVACVVRGDAEEAAPRAITALRSGGSLAHIPNLAFRDDAGRIVQTPIEYIDLDAHPSPSFPGTLPVVPYESMRGCPFSCKFCSFPAASPKWRYKSAEKISADWAEYARRNGTNHIRAMDSTFTVPPRRLRQLLHLLPDVAVGWEAFSRANSLLAPGVIDELAAAHCRTLSIGFESMSENTLRYMDKKVRATQNRNAFELLRKGDVNYRISFMAGYPGETPEDYRQTHDFLVRDYEGHFQLYVFSLQDETMPVWNDRERFRIRVTDELDPDYQWSHIGMDVTEAKRLRARTLREVRRRNDAAVALLWQPGYQTPLLPHRSAEVNYRVEKTVERLGMLPLDHPSPRDGAPLAQRLLAELSAEGIDAGGDPQAVAAAP